MKTPSILIFLTAALNAAPCIVDEEKLTSALQSGIEEYAKSGEGSGPLTEAVLLGCLASPFPGELLEWDSDALKDRQPSGGREARQAHLSARLGDRLRRPYPRISA